MRTVQAGNAALTGLWPPASIPFSADDSVDHGRLVAHGRALIAEGASGLAILGTTSEANSLSLNERRQVVETHLAAGIAPRQMIVGAGACAIEDAGALTRLAGEIGAAAVLLLPPFYYKGVTDDGLFAFVARVIERSGPNVPPILLYHIPPIAVVGWSAALIARLIEAFPGIVVGMKDASGDHAHTEKTIRSFPGFLVFPGSETHIVADLAAGAAGCIAASGNVNARAIASLIGGWMHPDAAARQKAVNAVRDALRARALIASVKAILAARYRDDSWLRVRPPLVSLDQGARSALLADPAIAGLVGAVAA
jgi:4-hydroxy-tetrahydrodipicolinate synthase